MPRAVESEQDEECHDERGGLGRAAAEEKRRDTQTEKGGDGAEDLGDNGHGERMTKPE